MRIRWGTVVAVAVVVVLGTGAVLAVVNGRGGDDGSTLAAGGGTAAKSSTAVASDTGSSVTEDAAAPGRAASTTVPTPTDLGGLAVPELRTQVVKQATLELEVGRREGEATVRKVIDAVGVVHGYVESTDLSGGRSRLIVRVPAADFDATLDRILGLGHQRGLQVHGQDVTGAVTDLEARLRNLRAQEAVLLGLMGRATTIGDSIAVQQQLSQNQEQIEQLDGQRRGLADQTSFATLTVSIAPKGAPAATGGSDPTLGSAWADGVDAALAVIGGTLVVLGALAPILVLAGLGLLGWRLVRRRRKPLPTAPATG